MTEQDRIENALRERLSALFGECEEKIKKRLKCLLEALKRLDEEIPEDLTEEYDREWRNARFSVLLRRHEAEKVVSDELGVAGTAAAALITNAIADIFSVSYKQSGQRLMKEARNSSGKPWFEPQTNRMVRNILDETRDYFSEQAFTNLRSNRAAVRRYRKALAKSVANAETQHELVSRFLDILGDVNKKTRSQAELLAQTERTRAQSEANEEIADQAAAQGFRLVDKWSCAMIAPHHTRNGWSSGSRESHKELNGKMQPHGVGFETINGVILRFPGDPDAPANERCNCHCVKTSHILLDDEELVDGQIVKVKK